MKVQFQDAPQIVVTFEMLLTPNGKKSKAEGRPIYDEQEVCRIRFAGNKHTVGVYPAHEVFKQAADEFGMVQPVTYAMEYNDAYLKFKNGEAQTMAGTPTEEAPFLSAKLRLELKALNIYTVETLAALDGQPLKQLGMNGRELKNQAIAYLANAADTQHAVALAEALESRDREIAELRAMIAGMGGGSGSAQVPSTIGRPASPFDDFGADDLTNWIKEADPTARIDQRWGVEKLRALAEEINSKLAARAAA